MTTQTTISSKPRTVSTHETTIAFLNRLFPGSRTFAVRLWDGTVLAGTGTPAFTIVLNSPGSLRRMLRPPLELALSEAFIRGDFDIEGDLFAVFKLFESLRYVSRSARDLFALARLWLALPTAGQPRLTITRHGIQISAQRHSMSRDRAAIQYHYDIGNDFYALWLDQRMVYSCAYFLTGTEDINQAQERKLEYICRKLRLKSGDRLLDIGCGWGGLVIYAAQHYGVSALGVTLSKEQCRLAAQRIADAGLTGKVAVRLMDYRALTGESFDKIASIGMFEHVGRAHLPEYFENAYRLLKPGGLFLNHGIAVHGHVVATRTRTPWARLAERLLLGAGLFTQRYIFPDGELEPASEVNLIAEHAGFEVRDVENLREHYALTSRQWFARLDQHRSEIVALTDETLYRTWRLYLAGSVAAFKSGQINVNQSLIAKPVAGYSSLPLTRADLYT